MQENQKIAEITALKNLLQDSDYNSNKIVESLLTTMTGATAEDIIPRLLAWITAATVEYGDIVQTRAAWRADINAIEENEEE